jgi:hypothetical protein
MGDGEIGGDSNLWGSVVMVVCVESPKLSKQFSSGVGSIEMVGIEASSALEDAERCMFGSWTILSMDILVLDWCRAVGLDG